MKQQLQEILTTLYEAEGLLEMALRRGENSYATLAELARSKCYHAADLAAALELRHEEEPAPETHDEKDDAVKLFEEKIVPKLDAEQADATEKEAEEMASADPDPVPVPAQQPEERPMEEPAPEPAEEPEPDATPAEEIEQMQAEVPMPEDREGEREIADASIFEMEEEADDQEDSGNSDDSEEAEAPEETPRAPRNRRPIATFFSINDKFRFRRELFANNNREWLDALALLETMDNMEEAKDYLFDDLQWEADNAEVKAFISVLDRYYKS